MYKIKKNVCIRRNGKKIKVLVEVEAETKLAAEFKFEVRLSQLKLG